MPYTYAKPRLPETPDQLRARIPGWGVDKDPRDRPAVPRLQLDPSRTGAHWEFPDRQEERRPRERSVEHAFLTPVFGTAQPLTGIAGVIRKHAYARFSEARAAHWLLLMAGDRVDVLENRVSALLGGRPDRLVAETGVRSELSGHGLASRMGRRRSDLAHQWMDPAVSTPWLGVGLGAVVVGVARRRRRVRRLA